MSDDKRNHPLRETLVMTQETLQTTREEVCADVAIASTPTHELIRIEEALALASDAAKTAISLRQRLDAQGRGDAPLA